MVKITIRPLTSENADDLDRFKSAFTVQSELAVHARDGRISYDVRPVTTWEKRYARDDDPYDYLDRHDRAGWLAYASGVAIGQILLAEHWNRFAFLCDLAVEQPYRRQGVGSRLMQEAIAWARANDLAGVMVETQSVNVPACRFYESHGYVLRGFDAGLYCGLEPDTSEIALFYYLLF